METVFSHRVCKFFRCWIKKQFLQNCYKIKSGCFLKDWFQIFFQKLLTDANKKGQTWSIIIFWLVFLSSYLSWLLFVSLKSQTVKIIRCLYNDRYYCQISLSLSLSLYLSLTHAHTYTNTHTHTCIDIYIYTHTNKHTHIYIYIYIYTNSSAQSGCDTRSIFYAGFKRFKFRIFLFLLFTPTWRENFWIHTFWKYISTMWYANIRIRTRESFSSL